MTIIFWVTGLLILLYFLYPVWLMLLPGKPESLPETEQIAEVSMILLSYNGRSYLEEKIGFLISELASFPRYELIVVDDGSTDGSAEFLSEMESGDHMKILIKGDHSGIPHSMNLGVEQASYGYLLFCDQRQQISRGVIRRLLEPLKFREVGAVSCCISHKDKQNQVSLIRRYENFLKERESRTGFLIGVYGPLYAVKKECYQPIPGHIILDDLYLSLKILSTKKIEFIRDCGVTDDSITTLYDYHRARRYLAGFIQLLREKELIGRLGTSRKIMLFWHKYLRILIPLSLFLSYGSLGLLIMNNVWFVIPFGVITLAGIFSLLPVKRKIFLRTGIIIRINIHCFFGMAELFFTRLFTRRSMTVVNDP
jgi:glycosyltransferase involved in cell wall biosynthesis